MTISMKCLIKLCDIFSQFNGSSTQMFLFINLLSNPEKDNSGKLSLVPALFVFRFII